MDWRFLTKNKLVQHFKAHRLYWLFAPVFAWVMSNFLTTPKITAIAIVFLGYIALVILLEVWIRPTIWHRIKSERFCYFIIYFGPSFFCILIALLSWNTLVYMCDRNNPYRQPLRTGEAYIQVIVEPNGPMNSGIKRFGSAAISLIKKENLILEIWGFAACEQIENGQALYWVMPKLSAKNNSINKPIYYLAEAEYAQVWFEKLPSQSRIIKGEILFTFNSSVYIKIPITSQTIEDGVIVIRDIQKYFRRRN